jgi:hypothetical protein
MSSVMHLDWVELRFSLAAEGPWVPPPFSGSMLRGALAGALRRTVCVMRRPECDGCPLVMACLYPRLFETRPDPAAGVMRRYDRAPHPVLVVADLREGRRAAAAGETLTLRLFGSGIEAAPFLIHAAGEMARHGLGRGRVPFRLTGVGAGDGPALAPGALPLPPAPRPPPPHLPPRRRWRIRSPLRVFAGGRPLDAARIDGPALARATLRRVGLMAQFHGRLDPGVDLRALAAEAARVRLVARDLRWQPLRRWSGRQGASQSIGGLVGALDLDFSDAPGIAALADWVPVVHLGKETSMGLGGIIAEAA